MCLLSICIPTFNRARDLEKMLRSIKPNINIEVVVCDDGSTDLYDPLADREEIFKVYNIYPILKINDIISS